MIAASCLVGAEIGRRGLVHRSIVRCRLRLQIGRGFRVRKDDMPLSSLNGCRSNRIKLDSALATYSRYFMERALNVLVQRGSCDVAVRGRGFQIIYALSFRSKLDRLPSWIIVEISQKLRWIA